MMRPLWPSAQTLKFNACSAVIGGLVLGIALFFCPSVARAQTPVATATLTFEEKTLKGSYFGSARPQQDFPRLIGLYRGGRLKLDELITRTYGIEEAPQAFADLAAGRNARGVLLF